MFLFLKTLGAACFHHFCEKKVPDVLEAYMFRSLYSPRRLSASQPVVVADAISTTHRLADKCCMLDPFPIRLFESIADLSASFLVDQLNKSMQAGQVPRARGVQDGILYITPLLEKSSLDPCSHVMPRHHVGRSPICRSSLEVASAADRRIIAQQLHVTH